MKLCHITDEYDYDLIVVVDESRLDLAAMFARFDSAAAAGLGLLAGELSVPSDGVWLLDGDECGAVAAEDGEDFDSPVRLARGRGYDDLDEYAWYDCSNTAEELAVLEHAAGFLRGSASLHVSAGQVYLQVTHKHAEHGGYFSVALATRHNGQELLTDWE